MSRVLHWNGKDLPEELRRLPAGDYLIEQMAAEGPDLTAEEEAGIEAALDSHEQGRGVDSERARAIVSAALRR